LLGVGDAQARLCDWPPPYSPHKENRSTHSLFQLPTQPSKQNISMVFAQEYSLIAQLIVYIRPIACVIAINVMINAVSGQVSTYITISKHLSKLA